MDVAWAHTLAVAKAWGCKPWEVMGYDPTPFERWQWQLRTKELIKHMARRNG